MNQVVYFKFIFGDSLSQIEREPPLQGCHTLVGSTLDFDRSGIFILRFSSFLFFDGFNHFRWCSMANGGVGVSRGRLLDSTQGFFVRRHRLEVVFTWVLFRFHVHHRLRVLRLRGHHFRGGARVRRPLCRWWPRHEKLLQVATSLLPLLGSLASFGPYSSLFKQISISFHFL